MEVSEQALQVHALNIFPSFWRKEGAHTFFILPKERCPPPSSSSFSFMDLIKGYTPSGRPDNIIIDCGHMFHIECFDSHWKACDEAKNTVRCPNCRAPYEPAVRDGRHAQLVGNSAAAQDPLIDTVTQYFLHGRTHTDTLRYGDGVGGG